MKPHAVTTAGAVTRGHTAPRITAHGQVAAGVSNPALIWAVADAKQVSPEVEADARRAIDRHSMLESDRDLIRSMLFGDPISQQTAVAA